MLPLALALALTLTSPAQARSWSPWDLAVSLRSDTSPSELSAEFQAEYRSLVADLVAQAVATDASETKPASPQLNRELAQRASALGLDIKRQQGSITLMPDHEDAGAAGLLLIRTGNLPAEIVLAAPHPYDDLRTGTIASAIFEKAPIRAVHIATQSRHAGVGADPAHNALSTMQLSTDALSDALPGAWFVQIHGFGENTSRADGVVSGGASSTSSRDVERTASLLSTLMGGADVRTAFDVPQLAGFRNVQGQLLRGKARFLHLELGVHLRRLLAEDPGRCAALGDALVEQATLFTTPA